MRADDPTAANFKSLLSLMGTDECPIGLNEGSRILIADQERLNAALEALSQVCRAGQMLLEHCCLVALILCCLVPSCTQDVSGLVSGLALTLG